MQIQIVTTTTTTKPTARGSYQELEVVYKNLTFQGKVESKKLMSFGAGATSFKTLADASTGSTWEVVVVKNDKGYNDWVTVTPASAGAPAPQEQVATGRPNTSPKSTYETPEERAQRQVLIVRQSSISSAVTLLTAGAKAPPKLADVIDTAKLIENYVFGIKDPGPTGFDDLPDFEPVSSEIN